MTAGRPVWPGATGPLGADDCSLDWIRDREVETVSKADHVAMADRAWQEMSASLESRSPFYQRKFAAAGVRATDGDVPEGDLAQAIEAAIRARLVFRAEVSFVPRSRYGDAGYKTSPIVRR